MSSACSLPLARKATVGPLPETIPPSAPCSSPRSSACRSDGPEARRSRLQVVAQRRAEGVRVTGSQRRHQPVGDARLGKHAAAAQPVALGVHVCGGQPLVGERQHPLEAAAGERGRQPLAPAHAQGRATHQCEGDVAAELGGERVQLGARQRGAPQRVAGDQGGRRVGAAAGHPARDRDALVQVQVHAGLEPGALGEQDGGARRQVGGVGRHAVGADVAVAADGHLQPRPRTR